MDTSDMPSPRHDAALAYARAGIPIFPCKPNSKHPATPNGFKDATVDEQVINCWWAQADYNLATEPERAGWAVIDEDGEADRDWPETFEVNTPRGGIHRYFTGSIPSTVKKLGPHTDTRGRGGYVLLPPSVVNGRPYTVRKASKICPLPVNVVAELEKPTEQVIQRPDVELDQPHNIERGRAMVRGWLDRGRVAIEGAGGNNLTYQCACELRDLGLSAATVLRLLGANWNDACLPPWNSPELFDIIGNAFRYGQNSAGAWANPDPEKTFEAVAASVRASAPRSRFHFMDEFEMDLEPPAEWLFQDVLPSAGVALLVGAPSSYKSFVALHWSLLVGASENGAAFYACLEGRQGIAGARRRAWKAHNGVDALPGFFLGVAPFVDRIEDRTEFRDQVAARREAGARPRLIVLDTHARCMAGLDETSAKDTGKMLSFAGALVEEFHCCVLVIHHTGKNGETRGSSALEAGCDTVWHVTADHRSKTLKMVCAKQKDAPEAETPIYMVLQPALGSLVPQAISQEDWQRLTAGATPFSGPMIGAALRDLGATVDNPVSAELLAEKLCGGNARTGETVEAYYERVAWTAKQLAGLFRSGKLSGYGSVAGKSILWFLPAD